MAARRYNCSCGKKRYRDEPSALAAAAADQLGYDVVVRVYRCPGGLAWHLTANGFVPEALRSVGRRLAFELLERGQVELDAFLARTGPDRRRRDRAVRCAEQLTALGLVRRPAGDGGWLSAADPVGLARVVQVGLDAYAEERAS